MLSILAHKLWPKRMRWSFPSARPALSPGDPNHYQETKYGNEDSPDDQARLAGDGRLLAWNGSWHCRLIWRCGPEWTDWRTWGGGGNRDLDNEGLRPPWPGFVASLPRIGTGGECATVRAGIEGGNRQSGDTSDVATVGLAGDLSGLGGRRQGGGKGPSAGKAETFRRGAGDVVLNHAFDRRIAGEVRHLVTAATVGGEQEEDVVDDLGLLEGGIAVAHQAEGAVAVGLSTQPAHGYRVVEDQVAGRNLMVGLVLQMDAPFDVPDHVVIDQPA